MELSNIHSSIINEQQRSVFNMLLVLTMVAGVFFCAINIKRGLVALAIAEIAMSFVSLWVFLKVKTINDSSVFSKFALSYLSVFFTVMVFAMWQKSASITVFVWVFIIPVVSYLLVGRKVGKWLTLLFSSLAFAVYLVNFWTYATLMHVIALANILLCFVTIWFISHAFETASVGMKDKLTLMSLQDKLTGLYNRNALSVFFEQHPVNQALTMVVLDIDFFKKINDAYGHHVGDKSLQIVSKELTRVFGKHGHVLRIGGEEFCILLPSVVLKQGVALTKELLTCCASKPVEIDQIAPFNLTLSAGVAQYPHEQGCLERLHKLADSRLYQAKDAGRNRLVSS